MLLGFLGCLGALKEVKVMLGLVSWGAEGGSRGVTELGGGCGSSAATSWGDRGATWCHHILCLGSSSGDWGDPSELPPVPGRGWRGGLADPHLPCLSPKYFGLLLLLFAAQITVAIIVYTQRASVSAGANPGLGGGPRARG